MKVKGANAFQAPIKPARAAALTGSVLTSVSLYQDISLAESGDGTSSRFGVPPLQLDPEVSPLCSFPGRVRPERGARGYRETPGTNTQKQS